jgi:hypothetical protein
MTAMTPLLQGHQGELNNNTSLTAEEMPLQHGQQLPLQQQ